MKVTRTKLDGLVVIEPTLHRDARGFFVESWQRDRYAEAGVATEFVQDNFSRSPRGTLRGLHLQDPEPQGKLVTCLRGVVYDVALDVRRGSPTFARWFAIELRGDEHKQVYLPPGFAHGFCVVSDEADFLYKCTARYEPRHERGVRWDDPALGIPWPVERPILSLRDQAWPPLSALLTRP